MPNYSPFLKFVPQKFMYLLNEIAGQIVDSRLPWEYNHSEMA